MSLVCLEAFYELEGLERPDPDLASLCPGEDVFVADSEGQDGLVMLELLYALGGVEELGVVFGGVDGGGEGRGRRRHGRHVVFVGAI